MLKVTAVVVEQGRWPGRRLDDTPPRLVVVGDRVKLEDTFVAGFPRGLQTEELVGRTVHREAP